MLSNIVAKKHLSSLSHHSTECLYSVNNDLLAVELWPLRNRVKAEWFTLDGLLYTIARVACRKLVDRVIDNESDPGRREHVIHEVVLMVAPIVADFADLHALQVVIVADEGVHVTVQALQVVDRRRVKLHLDEVFRVRYKSKNQEQRY